MCIRDRYYCARAFITGEFAASLCWQIYFYLLKIFPQIIDTATGRWIQLGVAYLFIFGGIYWLERHFQKEVEIVNINRRELITVIIMSASVDVYKRQVPDQRSSSVRI